MDIVNLVNMLENKIKTLQSIKASAAAIGNIEEYNNAELEILQTESTLSLMKKALELQTNING